jgi:hypothetical protein
LWIELPILSIQREGSVGISRFESMAEQHVVLRVATLCSAHLSTGHASTQSGSGTVQPAFSSRLTQRVRRVQYGCTDYIRFTLFSVVTVTVYSIFTEICDEQLAN